MLIAIKNAIIININYKLQDRLRLLILFDDSII